MSNLSMMDVIEAVEIKRIAGYTFGEQKHQTSYANYKRNFENGRQIHDEQITYANEILECMREKMNTAGEVIPAKLINPEFKPSPAVINQNLRTETVKQTGIIPLEISELIRPHSIRQMELSRQEAQRPVFTISGRIEEKEKGFYVLCQNVADLFEHFVGKQISITVTEGI